MLDNCLHHTSAVPQPLLLLIVVNLVLAGFLGRKWSLWSVPTWLVVQRGKAVFIMTLNVIINDMIHFRTVSITPQPCHSHFCCWFFVNLALAVFLGRKWSLWSVPTWLAVQRSKALIFLNLYDSINDMKYFINCLHHTSALPQPF